MATVSRSPAPGFSGGWSSVGDAVPVALAAPLPRKPALSLPGMNNTVKFAVGKQPAVDFDFISLSPLNSPQRDSPLAPSPIRDSSPAFSVSTPHAQSTAPLMLPDSPGSPPVGAAYNGCSPSAVSRYLLGELDRSPSPSSSPRAVSSYQQHIPVFALPPPTRVANPQPCLGVSASAVPEGAEIGLLTLSPAPTRAAYGQYLQRTRESARRNRSKSFS